MNCSLSKGAGVCQVVRTVLFHRDYQGFTGGHLKVWDYFRHAEHLDGWQAMIYFSQDSRWNEGNPWSVHREEALTIWEPEKADVLFLGGYDWRMISEAERARYGKPILNVIQHVHHADPAHPLSEFLPHRAVRICVSTEVQDAILATGRVNGPTVVIPNGIDLADLPGRQARTTDWLVCGLKEGKSRVAKALGKRLAKAGDWGSVEVLTKLMPRAEFLAAMARARRVVLLPRETEGFYLPALEAMALGCLVICPDCVGNRSFCRDGFSAIVPASSGEDDVFAAMEAVRRMSGVQEAAMLGNAAAVAAEHSLERERAAFGELLARIDALW